MKTLKIPPVVVIDATKWRCGGSSYDNRPNCVLGSGRTRLLNEDGYQCCLGFIAEQSGVPKSNLMQTDPESLSWNANIKIDKLVSRDKNVSNKLYQMRNTKLANEAISINDNTTITISTKTARLRKLFAAHGIKLKFKNLKKAISGKQ